LLNHNLSVIGFGCVKLTSFTSKKKAIELLTCVYDNGVCWFDTAPLYGNGYSEYILGEFIKKLSKNDRTELKIVSKFGLGPETVGSLPIDLALKLNRLKKILRPSSQLINKHEVQSIVSARTFQAKNIQNQLENSLKKLGVEQIYGYLGHELLPDFLGDDIKKYLIDSKKEGKILNLGIGVNSTSILSILDQNTLNDWEILQYDGGFLQNSKEITNRYPNKIHVHHSLIKNTDVSSKYRKVNLIESHLDQFPNCHVLFSSNNKSHIIQNLATLKKWP
jgi:aryl-alcohol dehydrogenase-like predicted oxidoreductase